MHATQNIQWLPVKGYEGSYEVSDQGDVRSIARTVNRSNGSPQKIQSRIRRTCTRKTGHLTVSLSLNGKIVSRDVHRLVMEAFVGPCPAGQEVRHLNGNAADNRLDNLAYGTRQQNVRDMMRHGTAHGQAKTHCPRGHAYAGGNLGWNRGGKGYVGRICRACRSGYGYARYHGRLDQLQEISDRYYAEYTKVDLRATKRLALPDETPGVHITIGEPA